MLFRLQACHHHTAHLPPQHLSVKKRHSCFKRMSHTHSVTLYKNITFKPRVYITILHFCQHRLVFHFVINGVSNIRKMYVFVVAFVYFLLLFFIKDKRVSYKSVLNRRCSAKQQMFSFYKFGKSCCKRMKNTS